MIPTHLLTIISLLSPFLHSTMIPVFNSYDDTCGGRNSSEFGCGPNLKCAVLGNSRKPVCQPNSLLQDLLEKGDKCTNSSECPLGTECRQGYLSFQRKQTFRYRTNKKENDEKDEKDENEVWRFKNRTKKNKTDNDENDIVEKQFKCLACRTALSLCNEKDWSKHNDCCDGSTCTEVDGIVNGKIKKINICLPEEPLLTKRIVSSSNPAKYYCVSGCCAFSQIECAALGYGDGGVGLGNGNNGKSAGKGINI